MSVVDPDQVNFGSWIPILYEIKVRYLKLFGIGKVCKYCTKRFNGNFDF
jgi:hypothetical protein